MLQKILEFIL